MKNVQQKKSHPSIQQWISHCMSDTGDNHKEQIAWRMLDLAPSDYHLFRV